MLKLATLVYVKRPGQTLMIHRIKKAGDMHEGKWNGLGGKFELGETPEECAIREVYEESGLLITAPELRGILTFPGFRPEEDWYAFVFVARDFTGSLIDSPEGVLAWVDDDRLLDLPLWEGDRLFLPWLDEDRFFSAKFVYVDGVLVKHEVVFYPTGVGDSPVPSKHPETLSAKTESIAPDAPVARSAEPFAPIYTPQDDTFCWVCGAPVFKQHCKIICTVCGFRRDCSDP